MTIKKAACWWRCCDHVRKQVAQVFPVQLWNIKIHGLSAMRRRLARLFMSDLWWNKVQSFVAPKRSNFRNIQITQLATSAGGYKRPCQANLLECNQAQQLYQDDWYYGKKENCSSNNSAPTQKQHVFQSSNKPLAGYWWTRTNLCIYEHELDSIIHVSWNVNWSIMYVKSSVLSPIVFFNAGSWFYKENNDLFFYIQNVRTSIVQKFRFRVILCHCQWRMPLSFSNSSSKRIPAVTCTFCNLCIDGKMPQQKVTGVLVSSGFNMREQFKPFHWLLASPCFYTHNTCTSISMSVIAQLWPIIFACWFIRLTQPPLGTMQ